MHDKRGLSAIITTLLIVLLVLVAIGIVWGVIRNVVRQGTEGIELSAACLNTDVRATSVNCDNPAACVVTFERTGTNSESIAGIKLVFLEGISNSGIINEQGNIEALAGKTITIDSTLSNPSKLEVTVYFEDDSGKEQLCSTTSANIGSGISGSEGEYCGDGECNGDETCSTCEIDCGICSGATCGDDICDAIEETCETCEADCSACEGEYCGDGECNGDETCGTCEVDCSCGEGESCVEGTCTEITFIDSGYLDNTWPIGSGIYFDDDSLPQIDGEYYSMAVFFPNTDTTSCHLIVGYSYTLAYDYSAIVELQLSEPLSISAGEPYQIWEDWQECTDAHTS